MKNLKSKIEYLFMFTGPQISKQFSANEARKRDGKGQLKAQAKQMTASRTNVNDNKNLI